MTLILLFDTVHHVKEMLAHITEHVQYELSQIVKTCVIDVIPF